MSWLDETIKGYEEFESPLSFYYWSALASISAIVKDNIWLPRAGLYNLYPNIYVMLHADSGLKKGPPVSMARQLVETVNNTRTISGRSSIQGILKEMGTARTQPGGKVVATSTAFICSSELTSSLVDDPVAVKILTDLYDRNYNIGNWRSLLKMESFTLKDPVITMLTATNEAMSEDFFTKTAIQGGYFARTFIIHETKRNRINSLLVPPTTKPDLKDLAIYLKQLSALKGPMVSLGSREKTESHTEARKDMYSGDCYYYTPAGILYQEWYESFSRQIDDSDMRDDTGTMNRFGDSVLKVAILLSLARSPSLEICADAMEESIKRCESLIASVRKVTLGKRGMSKDSPLKASIIKELLSRENRQVSRQMLLKKMWMHYSTPQEFDDIMLGFDHADLIKTRNIGNSIIFIIEPDKVRELEQFLDGKKHRL